MDKLDFITSLDFEILGLVQKLRCGFLDFIMPVITHLGDMGSLWIASGVLLTCTKKHRRCGIAVLGGLLTGLIIGNLILKNVIARQRPCWIDESVLMLIAVPLDYSFPSGHTLSSFISATVLFHYDKRLGAAALTAAVLIAFSRLYLYVHFPSDVLAGVVLGIIIGIFASKITNSASERLCRRIKK